MSLDDFTPMIADGATHVHPGDTCPTCERRVPLPKQKTSPVTRVVSIRIPIDAADSWEEALDAAAKHIGTYSKPHHKFHTLNAGLILLLQGPSDVLGD